MTNTMMKAYIPFNHVLVSFTGLSSVDIRMMGLDEEAFTSGQRWIGIEMRGFILGIEEIDGDSFYVFQANQVKNPLESVLYSVDYKLYLPRNVEDRSELLSSGLNYLIPLNSPSFNFECYTERECLDLMSLAVDANDRELFEHYSDILSKIRSL